MYTVKIKPDILEHRLDCSFYNPVGLAATTKLNSTMEVNKLSELVDQRRKITNGVRGPEWATSKFKLIRLQDCEHWIVNSDAAASITKRQFDENRRCKLQANDIVVAIGGYIGNAAVVVDECDAVIGQHSAVLPEPEQTGADSRFLVAYLNSRFAEAIFSRYVSGTVQAGINLEDLRDLPAPKPNGAAQKYIGDKVRQAERLRTWAKETESSVTQYHQALVPSQSTLNFAKRVRLVSPARMSERLDAHFYPGVVDDYLRLHQQKFKPLGKLCTTIYNGQTQSETSSANSCKQITVTNLSSSFMGGTPRDVEMPGKQEKFLKPYDILMCNAAHNKAYIGKDLTFVHSEAAILPSTEVMTLRVDRNQVPASYVRAYLLTKLGYVQIQSTIRGITAHSYPDDMALLDIFVPELEDKYRDEWFACDENLAIAGKACEIATQLTHVAKSLVEALIEGQISEVELIAAEQALQSGNDQLDRHILNRLKADGIDGQGQALLSDVDQLYSLLQQASHS